MNLASEVAPATGLRAGNTTHTLNPFQGKPLQVGTAPAETLPSVAEENPRDPDQVSEKLQTLSQAVVYLQEQLDALNDRIAAHNVRSPHRL